MAESFASAANLLSTVPTAGVVIYSFHYYEESAGIFKLLSLALLFLASFGLLFNAALGIFSLLKYFVPRLVVPEKFKLAFQRAQIQSGYLLAGSFFFLASVIRAAGDAGSVLKSTEFGLFSSAIAAKLLSIASHSRVQYLLETAQPAVLNDKRIQAYDLPVWNVFNFGLLASALGLLIDLRAQDKLADDALHWILIIVVGVHALLLVIRFFQLRMNTALQERSTLVSTLTSLVFMLIVGLLGHDLGKVLLGTQDLTYQIVLAAIFAFVSDFASRAVTIMPKVPSKQSDLTSGGDLKGEDEYKTKSIILLQLFRGIHLAAGGCVAAFLLVFRGSDDYAKLPALAQIIVLIGVAAGLIKAWNAFTTLIYTFVLSAFISSPDEDYHEKHLRLNSSTAMLLSTVAVMAFGESFVAKDAGFPWTLWVSLGIGAVARCLDWLQESLKRREGSIFGRVRPEKEEDYDLDTLSFQNGRQWIVVSLLAAYIGIFVHAIYSDDSAACKDKTLLDETCEPKEHTRMALIFSLVLGAVHGLYAVSTMVLGIGSNLVRVMVSTTVLALLAYAAAEVDLVSSGKGFVTLALVIYYVVDRVGHGFV